jgi:multicomponent Na+:H+ antiporter subunit D
MTVLIALLVALPLLAAALSLALWRWLLLQQVVSVVVVGTCVIVSFVILGRVSDAGPIAVHLGGWEAPVGITLVADLLAMIVLAISLITVFAVLVFAIGQPRADKRAFYFHPLYLVLTAGVSACFLTGDLFNLFVAFEVMLCASYVLITLGGRREQLRPGMTYVVINLLASTLLITGVALVYAATGSVNMADVAVRLNEIPTAVRVALGAFVLVTFGIKAALFPLSFWLPDAYPTAPVAVTAVFAGLLTKVGVYAIIRTHTLLFPEDGLSLLLLVVAAATMLVGVLGAIAQDDIKRILSFHIVSQIGYMVFGLALFTVAGVAAAIFYVVHHIPVKTSLFLVNGLVEQTTGTASLDRLGGLGRRAPLIAGLFLLPALSLAGLPPFSGFLGKLALVEAGFESGAWLVTAMSLVVSILTLFSMTKIWATAFWGKTPVRAPVRVARNGAEPTPRAPALTSFATGGLVAVTLAVFVFAGPLFDLCQRAAEGLLDPTDYINAVLDR